LKAIILVKRLTVFYVIIYWDKI